MAIIYGRGDGDVGGGGGGSVDAAALNAAIQAALATLTPAQIGALALSQRGAVNGVASLGPDGYLLDAQTSPLARHEWFYPENQSAMLQLQATPGDVAEMPDGAMFHLLAMPPSTLLNWRSVPNPNFPVNAVAGKTGAVRLVTTDLDNWGTRTPAQIDSALDANAGTLASHDTAIVNLTSALGQQVYARETTITCVATSGLHTFTNALPAPPFDQTLSMYWLNQSRIPNSWISIVGAGMRDVRWNGGQTFDGVTLRNLTSNDRLIARIYTGSDTLYANTRRGLTFLNTGATTVCQHNFGTAALMFIARELSSKQYGLIQPTWIDDNTTSLLIDTESPPAPNTYEIYIGVL